MSRLHLTLLTILSALLMLGLVACSDSDDPVDPGGGDPVDTTAPQVAGVDPSNSEAGISVDEDIVITFNEPMDAATSSGQVTLSAGTITNLTWQDSRNLVVTHADWSEGAHITVTVGTGLADVAGNNLASAFTFSFYVYSSTLTVLQANPADGATDINRDSNVQILFSREVDESTVTANTTITDPNRTSYNFTVDSADEAVTLMIDGSLAASTEITVTLGSDVATWGGNTLGSDHIFSFTTGTEVDNTPPTVLSSFPAIGVTADPDIGYLQVTFSEPMNPMSFQPAAWNAELALILMSIEAEPTWNDDFTEVTVPLPSPLPDGLPMEMVFDQFTDANGVVQDSEWNWHATISGTPDYYPVEDDLEMVYEVNAEEGDLGNSNPTSTWDYQDYIMLEMQQDDSFHLARYEEDFAAPTGDYEIYQEATGALQWLGFTSEVEEGNYQEMLFSSSVDFLPDPLVAGTWSDNTTVTVPGEGSYSATLDGSVESIGDIHPGDRGSREEIYFKDVIRVVRVLNIQLDGTPAIVQTDTTWYSPTVGPIRMINHEESTVEDYWEHRESWRILGSAN